MSNQHHLSFIHQSEVKTDRSFGQENRFAHNRYDSQSRVDTIYTENDRDGLMTRNTSRKTLKSIVINKRNMK